MGCDIHSQVEYKRGGRWHLYEGPWLCYFCDGEGPAYTRRVGRECLFCGGSGRVNTPWHLRNYDVFGMLAGVRTDAWRVMSADRDLPKDFSIDPDDDDHWMGDHSYGFVTLDDLHAYDWFQVKEASGVVGMSVYARWDHVTPWAR